MIIDARKIGDIIIDARGKGRVNQQQIQVALTEKLMLKIKTMSLKNKTSYSEIVRYLISNSDFKNFSFRTKGEITITARSKKK